ncbi:hypothetical protein PTH_1636 [Pelotomaculum thermopropionicum SI]|uniref:Uncharacterized protein n=1 Tax=Pelotomaculum thermopropionicum (strain DSM 13744 / JCM 10971 / SI) TaxID=370438 RepID=A5D1P9_PELTS|nr:hypothetical protein PTH_1636 [Pelotomaculum thermopropionicum SI]
MIQKISLFFTDEVEGTFPGGEQPGLTLRIRRILSARFMRKPTDLKNIFFFGLISISLIPCLPGPVQPFQVFDHLPRRQPAFDNYRTVDNRHRQFPAKSTAGILPVNQLHPASVEPLQNSF